MPTPLIYKATELASQYSPVKPLCGTRKAAQSYVDRITRSHWWKSNAPGFWDYTDPPPTRVWVWLGTDDDGGLMNPGDIAILNGVEMPSITLGTGMVNDHPAIADKWIIHHELAHVMTAQVEGEGHHGKQFVVSYIDLVNQFLGPSRARALIDACKEVKIKMNYHLLLS